MCRSPIQPIHPNAVILVLLVAWMAPLPCVASPLVVVLISHDGRPYQAMLEGFQETLRDQGKAVRYQAFSLEGETDRGARIAQEIGGTDPALVYALGGLATRVAAQAFPQGPIVSGMVLGTQTLDGASHVTGVALDFPIETQFQWLTRLLPDYRTIGVLYNPEQNGPKVQAARAVARKLGLRLLAIEVDSPKELPAALDTMMRRADVLWGIPDRVVFSTATAKAILLASFRNRVPFIGLSNAWVKAGRCTHWHGITMIWADRPGRWPPSCCRANRSETCRAPCRERCAIRSTSRPPVI